MNEHDHRRLAEIRTRHEGITAEDFSEGCGEAAHADRAWLLECVRQTQEPAAANTKALAATPPPVTELEKIDRAVRAIAAASSADERGLHQATLMMYGPTLLPRLAAAERARRAEDAEIRSLLEEAGIAPREGDTVRTMVERLIADANEGARAREAAEHQTAGLLDDLGEAHALLNEATEKLDNGTERPEVTKCGACLAVRQDEIAERRKSGHTLAVAERAFLQSNGWQPVTTPGMQHLWRHTDDDRGITQATLETALAITRRETR